MDAMWRGHIAFGLISIPVGLYSAVETKERVSFRLLHKKDHAPIKYKKFCSIEDVEVSNDEIVKGYEVEKNRFVIVEKEELEKVQESVAEADRTIEILQCIDFALVNPLLIEKPYYLAPEKSGQRAYVVLRQALADAKRVGIARFTLRSKPNLAVLLPGRREMSLAVLRSFEELRDPKDLPVPDIESKPAEVKLGRTLIDQMSEEAWDPTAHPNEYRQALEKLLASKKKVAITDLRQPEKVVDLMEALRRSVGATKPAARAGKRTARKPRQRAA